MLKTNSIILISIAGSCFSCRKVPCFGRHCANESNEYLCLHRNSTYIFIELMETWFGMFFAISLCLQCIYINTPSFPEYAEYDLMLLFTYCVSARMYRFFFALSWIENLELFSFLFTAVYAYFLCTIIHPVKPEQVRRFELLEEIRKGRMLSNRLIRSTEANLKHDFTWNFVLF